MQLVHDGKLNLVLAQFFLFFFLSEMFYDNSLFLFACENLSLSTLLSILISLEFFWYFFTHQKLPSQFLGIWASPNDYLYEVLNLLVTWIKCFYIKRFKYIVNDNWPKSKYFIKVCVVIRWENSTRQQRDREEETFTTEYEWRHWNTSSNVALQKSTHR